MDVLSPWDKIQKTIFSEETPGSSFPPAPIFPSLFFIFNFHFHPQRNFKHIIEPEED